MNQLSEVYRLYAQNDISGMCALIDSMGLKYFLSQAPLSQHVLNKIKSAYLKQKGVLPCDTK